MKYFTSILSLLITANSFSQNLTRGDVINHIIQRWQSVNIKKTDVTVLVDSQFLNKANYYYIDGSGYDSSGAFKRILLIKKSDFAYAAFSLYTELSAYKPRIGVFTKKEQTNKAKKENLNYVKAEAFNLRKSAQRDTVYGSGSFALIVDDKLIEPVKARTKFFSMEFSDIKCIHSVWGYQIPYYGEDSKNGVVFIWTKKGNN